MSHNSNQLGQPGSDEGHVPLQLIGGITIQVAPLNCMRARITTFTHAEAELFYGQDEWLSRGKYFKLSSFISVHCTFLYNVHFCTLFQCVFI